MTGIWREEEELTGAMTLALTVWWMVYVGKRDCVVRVAARRVGEKKGEEEREMGKGPETVNAGQLHRDWQDNQGLVKQGKTKIPKKKQ